MRGTSRRETIAVVAATAFRVSAGLAGLCHPVAAVAQTGGEVTARAPLRVSPGANESVRAIQDRPRVREALGRLYRGTSPQLLWSRDGILTVQAREMVALLERAQARGLRPADYQAAVLRRELDAHLGGATGPNELAEFDRSLSRSVLRLLDHLHTGRVDPRTLGFAIPESHAALDLATLATSVSQAQDVHAAVSSAEPPYSGYAALLGVLERYRRFAADSPAQVPARVRITVRPGDRYSDALVLRELLVRLGDLGAPTVVLRDSGGAALYAGDLVEAVAAFQHRHGLVPDGLLGDATIAQLRVPMASRVRQIELTLERWRWLPDRPPARFIVVNVPAFRLAMFEDDPTAARPVLTMNVIVGQAHGRHHTPVFANVMREVVFRPYWDIPPNIARRELLPIIRRNPAYLARESLEIVGGGDVGATVYPPTAGNLDRVAAGTLRLRQRPGPSNSLGLAKFVFPNQYNVYMHGTPAQQLFASARRDFSHGCIRVEDPTLLAETVLSGQPDWDRPSIEAAMEGQRTLRVAVARPVSVYVLYATVVVDEPGRPRFLADVYGHDARLARALGL